MSKAHRYVAGAISGVALTSFAAAFVYRRSLSTTTPTHTTSVKVEPTGDPKMTVNHSFRTLFAVPMTCDGCVKDVSETLYKVSGIAKVEANLADQLVSIEGTAPPSAIVQALEASGRDAILRGSGTSNSAAVSILETYQPAAGQGNGKEAKVAEGYGAKRNSNDRLVRGLARLVQVSPTVTLIDLTVLGVAPGVYHASIRDLGDLKDGVLSTGQVWAGADLGRGGTETAGQVTQRGDLGTVEVGADGRGAVFIDRAFQVWEVIGHALAVSPVSPLDELKSGTPLQNDENTAVGVIARSAGVWDNDKTVCSCSGKTLWEERKDEVKKGML